MGGSLKWCRRWLEICTKEILLFWTCCLALIKHGVNLLNQANWKPGTIFLAVGKSILPYYWRYLRHLPIFEHVQTDYFTLTMVWMLLGHCKLGWKSVLCQHETKNVLECKSHFSSSHPVSGTWGSRQCGNNVMHQRWTHASGASLLPAWVGLPVDKTFYSFSDESHYYTHRCHRFWSFYTVIKICV